MEGKGKSSDIQGFYENCKYEQYKYFLTAS